MVLLSIFLLAFLTYVANSDWLVRRIEDLRRGFYSRTSAWGFTVDDVIVIGRNKTSLSDIREMTNIRRGDNILAVDLEFLRNNLEALPWVKEVTLRRSFFPNVIQINLQEREVRALWQLDNRFHPIDADGKVIEAPLYAPRADSADCRRRRPAEYQTPVGKHQRQSGHSSPHKSSQFHFQTPLESDFRRYRKRNYD